MLRVLSEYIPDVPSVREDGIFGSETRNAVIAFQRFANLTPDGIVGPATWTALYDRSASIASATRDIVGQFPGTPLKLGDSDYS
jgi:peptidoglycan hydrolase-like protein with peptidoglycan-binding domain